MLAEQISVDYVFVTKNVYRFDAIEADLIQESILQKLKPSFLITNFKTDKFWLNKKQRAKKFSIRFLGQKTSRLGSSTKIVQKLEAEL